MKFNKKLLAIAMASVFASSAFSQNLGFEDGNTTGWTSTTLSAVGSTTTQAGQNTWVINPYGSYMGQLQIQSGTFNQMSTALGLTSSSSTGITTLLQQQAQTGGGNPTPTTAGWVTKEVTLTAGQTFTLAWQYVSVDYVPFNDGSIATLTQNGTSNATVNNYNQQYALLGFTNPGTGDYSTGSYGATGWQVATFQVSTDGTYTLGFGVFNLGDTALSPVLYIDEVQGTTTKNGVSFGAVAPNNATAPTAPTTTPTPTPPPTPTTVSSVGSGTTVDTSNLASSVTVNGGTIQIASTGITLTNTFTTDTNGMTVDQNGNTVNFSGVISGSGGVTIANTSTGGGVTFSAVNTYTGTTTINSGAGLENTGTIAGPVSNQGTFLNSGTAGNVTNGFNGDGNTAVAINTSTGTVGNVTNYSSFANSGTTGNVTNFGTFTNTGNVATFNNAGILNNNVGGVVNELGYNNFLVQNSGTINSITYNGGSVTNNSGGTIGSIDTTQSHGTFHNYGTVTGTVTTNSTFNNYAGGSIAGLYTNSGILTNAGTTSDWNNSNVITNSGTMGNGTNNADSTFTNNSGATAGNIVNAGALTNYGTLGTVNNSNYVLNHGTTGDVTNSGAFTSDGTVGNVVNQTGGSFANNNIAGNVTNSGNFSNNGTAGNIDNTGTFTNSGNTGSVTNTGTFNYTSGTLGSYTQTSPGTTVMFMDQPFVITGAAALGGGLIINNSPTAYGKYPVLNANSVSGTYDSFTSNGVNDYLKYSGNEVKLYVTPSSTSTQASINATASNLANAINLQSNAVTSGLNNDCSTFGESGACASITAGMSNASSGDLYTGGLILAKKINDQWRAGVFTNAPFNNPTIGNVGQSSEPAYGAFATWTKDKLSIQGSAAVNQGTLTVTRNGPETGVGKSSVSNQAYQLKASYAMPVDETVTVTPYAGIRYTESNYGSYTETGPVFPLTVNSTKKTSTDAVFGVSVAKQLTDKLTGSLSAGVVQNLSGQSANYTGTSEIGGLTTFNSSLPSNGSTNPTVGAGLTYSIDKTTKVGANVGWQTKGDNANISTVGISLTKGF